MTSFRKDSGEVSTYWMTRNKTVHGPKSDLALKMAGLGIFLKAQCPGRCQQSPKTIKAGRLSVKNLLSMSVSLLQLGAQSDETKITHVFQYSLALSLQRRMIPEAATAQIMPVKITMNTRRPISPQPGGPCLLPLRRPPCHQCAVITTSGL